MSTLQTLPMKTINETLFAGVTEVTLRQYEPVNKVEAAALTPALPHNQEEPRWMKRADLQ